MSATHHRCRQAALALALGCAGLGTGQVSASGVDGAARIVVVPLVMVSPQRESLVTLTNAGPEPFEVQGLYVGADGTPARGEHACIALPLPAGASRTVPLSVLCPEVRGTDAEDFGYVEFVSRGDAHLSFSATSWVETDKGRTFAIDGVPVGAFDPSQDNDAALRVQALDGEVLDPLNPQPLERRVLCYAATRDEPKDVTWVLDKGRQGQPIALQLGPRQMVRLDALAAAGLAPGLHTRTSADLRARDAALVIAGCAVEDVSSHTLDYRLAQTEAPLDTARLRHVALDTGVVAGPWIFASGWGTPAQPFKVVLSTYLHRDDQVRCRLVQPTRVSPQFDPTPWLELRVVDPDGAVRAGGDRATDSGEFSTGVRNALSGGYRNRWAIEISLDEASQAQVPYPTNQPPGLWGLECWSAAGMSQPLPVATHAAGGFADDF